MAIRLSVSYPLTAVPCYHCANFSQAVRMANEGVTMEGVPLAAIPLFAGVSERSMELLRQAPRRHYQDGDVIFHKGERSIEMIVLLHGQVRIEVDDVLIITCPPYEVIGEQ